MTMDGGARRPGITLPPFQQLLDEHAAAVLRFLTRRVGPDAADDCFQETFLAALRAYPRLRDGDNLRGWLLAIARNKATDALRAAARRPVPTDAIADVAADQPGASDPDLWNAVRRLPAKQRSAVAMRFAEDRSYDEIAEQMAISPEAARRNVHEGIKKLRSEGR